MQMGPVRPYATNPVGGQCVRGALKGGKHRGKSQFADLRELTRGKGFGDDWQLSSQYREMKGH